MNKVQALQNTGKILDTNIILNSYFSNAYSFIKILQKLGGTMYVDAAVLDEVRTNQSELIKLFNEGVLKLYDPENKYPLINDEHKVHLKVAEQRLYRKELKMIRKEFDTIEKEKKQANPNHKIKSNSGEIASLALARVLHLPIFCTDDSSVSPVIQKLDLKILVDSIEGISDFIQTYTLLDLVEVIIKTGIVPKVALKKFYYNAIKNDTNKDYKKEQFSKIDN